METMQLITTSDPQDLVALDLVALDDESIEAYFAEAGLTVEVVEHCDDLTCPACMGSRPARAA